MSVRAVIVPGSGANYGSLLEACRRIGVEAEVSDERARIETATHVLLPGVGAAAYAMRNLRERGLDRVLPEITRPLLGICLGMQLLFESSEESTKAVGKTDRGGESDTPDETVCLGLLPGKVRRLPPAPSWPHMGWNTIHAEQPSHPLLNGIQADDWFYFVHGYAASVDAQTVARSEHGEPFTVVVAHRNVYGVQFHPEKSAAAGRRLLANFFSLS